MRRAPFALVTLLALSAPVRAEDAGEATAARPWTPGDARARVWLAACGAGDEALAVAAARIARRELDAADPDAVAEAVRDAGGPWVRPRAWTLAGRGLGEAEVAARLGTWLAKGGEQGERRCGVVRAGDGKGGETVAAVVAWAQADLAPVPRRVRPSSWVTVEARARVAASGAQLVVLGPTGAPRTLLASFADGRAKARFSADRPSTWLVQLLLDGDAGPLPAAEARVVVGGGAAGGPTEAPGEAGADEAAGDADDLARMLAAARAFERVPRLARDAALDRVAQAHAEAMRAAKRLAHDAGDGDPRQRVDNAGIACVDAGENVAHARTIALAHRALWASPSHRANVLHPAWERFGVGVARDADGSVWVTEAFAR